MSEANVELAIKLLWLWPGVAMTLWAAVAWVIVSTRPLNQTLPWWAAHGFSAMTTNDDDVLVHRPRPVTVFVMFATAWIPGLSALLFLAYVWMVIGNGWRNFSRAKLA